jgi:hypothetical protein
LLGFAAVCTAGILLPLHLTIGIRLPEEDEIEGLDVTGKLLVLLIKSENKRSVVIAHGESWEVAASRAVGNLVKQILKEENSNKEQPAENGTFELRYKPANVHEKPITVPLSPDNKLSHHQSNHYTEFGASQEPRYNTSIRL